MDYYKDVHSEKVSHTTAHVLVEAMPWIKNITGKTIVIKYGGAAMVNAKLRSDVMADIVLLKLIGLNPVIVHGGGKAISAAMEAAQLPVEFIDGMRVTTPEAMDVVQEVLVGTVNQQLVQEMNEHGNLAVGISGADAGTIIAEPINERLGRVGKITRINKSLLEGLLRAEYIPVIASIALGADGKAFNVNADVVASSIAEAIEASKLIFLSDIDGLYVDFEKKESLLSRLNTNECMELIDGGNISSGMIPKLKSCVHALEHGVHRVHMINGTTPHALLLELLTDRGIGTMVYKEGVEYSLDSNLTAFAQRLQARGDVK